MTLDDIPEGKTLTLTAFINRLFKYAGCDPTCHACSTVIKVGELFKLAMHRRQIFTGASFKRLDEPRDTMLCGNCTVDDLTRTETNRRRRYSRYLDEHPRAGYSRPSRATDHDEPK